MELQGFRPAEQRNVEVRLGQRADLSLKLTVGGMTETVEVTTPLLWYAASIGGATSVNVDHNLGTTDVIVQLFLNSTGETILADVTRTTSNRVVVAFAVDPGASAVRVLVMAAG